MPSLDFHHPLFPHSQSIRLIRERLGIPHMVIGITGNIGSGKSTVAQVFAEQGSSVIEGDALGREVVEEDEAFRGWLREQFGEAVWDGERLDRAALGRIVFRDKQARDALNEAIWPHIRRRLEERIARVLVGGGIPVVDAALIFEWGDEERYDRIVAVIVDPEVGARRAAERMNLSEKEMMDRYRMQIPAEEKARRADLVLRNDGSLEDLRRHARQTWEALIATTPES